MREENEDTLKKGDKMTTFKLASFNICSAHFKDGVYSEENLALLAEKIVESGAQVVALQEVDRGAMRSCGVDMPKRLSDMTGLEYHYFIKIRDFQGGEYGTAILSSFPIKESRTLNFPVKIATQGTSCGYCVLDVGGCEVTVFNTHLSIENEESNTECLVCLGDILRKYHEERGAFICCGDFNTQPEKVRNYIPWVELAHNGLHTYADRSIDHILYTSPIKTTGAHTRDTQSDGTTDHNMVVVEVEI